MPAAGGGGGATKDWSGNMKHGLFWTMLDYIRTILGVGDVLTMELWMQERTQRSYGMCVNIGIKFCLRTFDIVWKLFQILDTEVNTTRSIDVESIRS